MFALSSTLNVLAIIGLVVGLVVFCLVVYLLNETLAPLRKILADLQSAQTAPMLERGVPGTELVSTTRQLVEPVPGLALAYLQKLGLTPRPQAPAAPVASSPFMSPPPAPAPVASAGASPFDTKLFGR